MKFFHSILINHAPNGITVKVGCVNPFVYQEENLDQFLKDLKEYMLDPKKKETEVREKYKLNLDSDQAEGTVPETAEQPVRYTRRRTGLGMSEQSGPTPEDLHPSAEKSPL